MIWTILIFTPVIYQKSDRSDDRLGTIIRSQTILNDTYLGWIPRIFRFEAQLASLGRNRQTDILAEFWNVYVSIFKIHPNYDFCDFPI